MRQSSPPHWVLCTAIASPGAAHGNSPRQYGGDHEPYAVAVRSTSTGVTDAGRTLALQRPFIGDAVLFRWLRAFVKRLPACIGLRIKFFVHLIGRRTRWLSIAIRCRDVPAPSHNRRCFGWLLGGGLAKARG